MSFFLSLVKTAKHLLTKKTTGAVVGLIISFVYFARVFGKSIPQVKLSYFLLALTQNNISEVFVNGGSILFKGINSDSWFSTNASMLTKDRVYKLLKNKPNIVFSCAEPDQLKLTPGNLILFSSVFLASMKLSSMYFNSRTSQKSREGLYSTTTFQDIYGLEDAKQELKEIIDYLKEPAKYQSVGARLRRGVLLYGPSGTGKTLLAKATAGESKAAFLSCTGSEFMEMYVGVGPKRVRDLFDKARSVQPCIIFIDEIDGIGMKRKSEISASDLGVGDNERSSTLNQLLTEMDGFRESANIVVIAATNRVSLLDEALLRSGRFDTKLKIDLPNEKERLGIMKVHLRNKKSDISESTLEKVAKVGNGLSGADLENLVNESAYLCIQRHQAQIQDKDVEDAYVKLVGQKKLK